MKETQRFFSKAGMHNAIWSLLVGLVCFGVGVAWSSFKGKEKVIIATTEDGAKPIVVRVQKTPDDPALLTVARIDVLVDEVRRLREQTKPTFKLSTESPNHLSPLPTSSEQARDQPVPLPRDDALLSANANSYALNLPFLPKFELPSVVHGYMRAGLAGFGKATCPAGDVLSGGSVIFPLTLTSTANVQELTPVFLRISRPTGINQITQVFSQQYLLRGGQNYFQIPFDVPAGAYQFDIGFYSRGDLDRAYPNFYGLSCNVNVR